MKQWQLQRDSYQQVFWFEVPVHNGPRVEVVEGVAQIFDHASRVHLSKLDALSDGVE